MENQNIVEIKHQLKILKEMAEHSRSMSIGAKLIIKNTCAKIENRLEIIDLELMASK